MSCGCWPSVALLLLASLGLAHGSQQLDRASIDRALSHEFLEDSFRAGSSHKWPNMMGGVDMMENAIMGNGAPPPMQEQDQAIDSNELNAQLEQNDDSLSNMGDSIDTLGDTQGAAPSLGATQIATQIAAVPFGQVPQPDFPYPPAPPAGQPPGSPYQAVRPLGMPRTESDEEKKRAALIGEQSRWEQMGHHVAKGGGVPANFWSWKTTPAPPVPPAPNPQVMWIQQTDPPFPTTPPIYENCYACDCLFVYDTDVVQGGAIPDKYTCYGGKPTIHVPQFKWAGMPKNSGLDHPIRQPDGTSCIKSQSFAITMVDLDYPHGTGQAGNSVRNMFWAVNIPGDWTEFTEQLAHTVYKDVPTVVVGKNDAGQFGMEVPCPENGVHRYMFTLWALKSYLGTELSPVDPNTPASAILPLLEEKELSRFSFYGTLASQGYGAGTSFIQQATKNWFR